MASFLFRSGVLGMALVLFSTPAAKAQQEPLLTQEDLCPDYREVDPLKPCESVRSYAGLKLLIEQAEPGASVDLCPFFVQKVSSMDPIFVRKGIQVTCVKKTPDDICAINGMGHHVWIDTAADTLWQGMSFRGSDDHAVYVAGDVDNAAVASHTFCQTSFIKNVRTKDTRGGAFMAESSSGTINIVQCLFSENFSMTYGAAVYSRTDQLNIINSIFVKNKASGYGGAIFTASGASLMIRDTVFFSNNGREDHDIVYNPSKWPFCFKWIFEIRDKLKYLSLY
jgi:predicted outer membrane repeat protein